jgi:hypothetical protein
MVAAVSAAHVAIEASCVDKIQVVLAHLREHRVIVL